MIEYHTIFAFAFTVCLTKRDEQYIKCTGIPLGLIFFSVLYFATIIPVQPTPRKMKFTTVAATFAGLTTFIQAAPAVPVSEEIQTIQHDIKNLNSDFNNLIQSLNLNLNEATQEDLAKGYESDELIAELGRSLLEASRNQNGDVLSILHQVTKRDAVDDDIVGAVDVSKRGGFVTIHDHQISIDAIIKAIEYVIIFNHPLPNSDHFDHVLKILGIDADLAAQVNLTYHTVTIDFVAILTKLIDIGHDVVDIAEKVITITIAGKVIELKLILKAIEYIFVLGHALPNAVYFDKVLSILGIDVDAAHSIGIWETSSSFDVAITLFKYIGLGFVHNFQKRGGVVTIQEHQISIDLILKAINYVIILDHPLPNPDHFDHVLKILGIDAELAAQVNLTYHTVTIDFVAILTKLIDIGHDVVDIAEKVITVTIAGVVLKIEVLIKAIEYIIIQHHYLPNHDHFLGLLAILGIDIETAHSIGIWETSSTFEVVAIFTKYIGLGVFNDVPNTAE